MTIQFTAPVLWIAINCMYRQMYLHVNFICALIMSTALLKAYCTPLYTSHMWCSHSKGKMDKLKVAYNEALRILLKYPRWESASKLYVNCNDPTFHRSTFFLHICIKWSSMPARFNVPQSPACLQAFPQSLAPSHDGSYTKWVGGIGASKCLRLIGYR